MHCGGVGVHGKAVAFIRHEFPDQRVFGGGVEVRRYYLDGVDGPAAVGARPDQVRVEVALVGPSAPDPAVRGVRVDEHAVDVEQHRLVVRARTDVVEVMEPFVRGLPHHPQDGAAFPREPDSCGAPLRFADLAREGGEPVDITFEIQQDGGQWLLVVGALLGVLVVAHRFERGLVLGQRAANPGVVDRFQPGTPDTARTS